MKLYIAKLYLYPYEEQLVIPLGANIQKLALHNCSISQEKDGSSISISHNLEAREIADHLQHFHSILSLLKQNGFLDIISYIIFDIGVLYDTYVCSTQLSCADFGEFAKFDTRCTIVITSYPTDFSIKA